MANRKSVNSRLKTDPESAERRDESITNSERFSKRAPNRGISQNSDGENAPKSAISTSDNRDNQTNLGSCENAGSLMLAQQPPVAPMGRLVLDDRAPTEIAREFLRSDGVQDAIIDAILDAARGLTPVEFLDHLTEAGLEGSKGGVHVLIRRIATGDPTAMWRFLRFLAHIGEGHSSRDDLLISPRLLAMAAETPAIDVRLERGFFERRREEREVLVEFLAELSRGAAVRVAGSRIEQRRLYEEHRETLPVSREDIATRPEEVTAPDVDGALVELDPDGREVDLLRALASRPSETAAYTDLYDAFDDVASSRVRQLLGRLAEFGLVEAFGSNRHRRVELRPSGREFLDALAEKIGHQETLSSLVSGTGTSAPKSRGTRPRETSPTDGPGPFSDEWLSRAAHHAAVATGESGGVSLVSDATTGEDHPRTRFTSYDNDQNEAVVAVRATGPLPYMVSSAVALASERFLAEVLPDHRLGGIDISSNLLRNARNIGGLSAEATDDPAVLRKNLVEWGDHLEQLTTKLNHGDYDDRDASRGEIMRSAHGLAGSIVHLLDAADIDIVRELRIPRGLDADSQLRPLAKSIALSAAIQSRYGHHVVYRHLFESREEKRDQAINLPDEIATDPLGDLIGSFVLRGPDVHRLQKHLRPALRHPADLADDAPEIAVSVPIRTHQGRPVYAEAVRRMAEEKNLSATREAVSFIQALVATPHDAAEAFRGLAREEKHPGRDIRLDELRVALSSLPEGRLLEDAPPTVSRDIHALLTATEPLTQAELAERADVSTRSLRQHREVLEALDLLDVDAGEYRLRLTFPDEYEDVSPSFLESDARPVEAIYAVAEELLVDPSRLADPDTRLGRAFTWPPDLDVLLEAWWWWWASIPVTLTGSEFPEKSTDSVTFGQVSNQASLDDVATSGAV